MTSEETPAASPWLTTWFKPRQSITHVINTGPRQHVLLLAALGLISATILQLLLNGWAPVLLDWRAITAIVIGGAVLGVNGKEVPRRRVADFVTKQDAGQPRPVPAYEETLPNGVRYTVLNAEANSPLENIGPFKVPAGKYFVMGDNRDDSIDSRASLDVGYVPFDNLMGRAGLLFSTSPERSGTTVR